MYRRLEIYGALNKWELMQTVAKKLALFDPDNPEWTADWAYATRRADCIEAARLILLEAIERLPNEAVIHYKSCVLRLPVARFGCGQDAAQTCLSTRFEFATNRAQ